MPLCTSFKIGLLDGEFDFSSDTTQVFKIALYDSDADINVDTTAYSATDEVPNGSGYTTGGETLTISTNPTALNGGAYLSFSNVTWTAATFTVQYALIYKYNGTTNPAVAAIEFTEELQVSAGDFTVQFPSAAFGTPIILLS